MATKAKKKQALPSTAWGPDNPPPISPGRPPKEDAIAMMAEEQSSSPGIPERLAALRVAVRYASRKYPPKHSMVRFYWELRGKNAREFAATWERLEKEFEAGQLGVVAAVSVGAEEEPVKATETDEELREAIVELLRKHGEQL